MNSIDFSNLTEKQIRRLLDKSGFLLRRDYTIYPHFAKAIKPDLKDEWWVELRFHSRTELKTNSKTNKIDKFEYSTSELYTIKDDLSVEFNGMKSECWRVKE